MFLKTIALSLSLASPVLACGVETDCDVAGGTYRIDMPNGTATGAIVFAHGYRGSAAGTIRNDNLRRMATDQGLAFVALDAGEDDWALPNAPGARGLTDGAAEMDYVAAVVDDLITQHGIPADRLMMSGFSAGGMMTWSVACLRPDLFAGFAPVSGTFWLEAPDNCTGPTPAVIHMHGDTDPVVPMQGRPIGNTHQGDVMDALDMHRTMGSFAQTDSYTLLDGRLDCEGWRNPQGAVSDLCMFQGGHSFSRTYLAAAWTHFAQNGLIPPPG